MPEQQTRPAGDMDWLVGLDLRAGAAGPTRFAAWLAGQLHGARIDGVRVLETEGVHLFASGSWEERLDPALLARRAEEDIARLLDQTGATAALASTAVARDTSAEAHLEALAQARPGVGLILGRRAPTAGGRVVRLGRVARRLLRALPGPVVIVPPDLDPAALGDGPVIATTDARDDSLPACRFAVALARALGRSALLVHVVPTPDVWIHEAVMLPPEQVFGRLQAEGEAALARWAQRHELDALERFVDVGGVVHGVEAIAQARNAPLIVCGSRQLGAIPRFFAGSVASELAASSRLPVAVIPHDYKDRRNAEAAS